MANDDDAPGRSALRRPFRWFDDCVHGPQWAAFRERLAPQKTPARWIRLPQFPLTPSGKIQKFVLRQGLRDEAGQEPR